MVEYDNKSELAKTQTFNEKGKQIGRYRLMSKIGQGGAGTVYKARDTKLDRVVALKLLSLAGFNEKSMQRFSREARCNAKLRHPNIVVLYDFEQIGNDHYLVMDYVDGQSLEKLMGKKRLPIGQTCQIMLDLLSAMQYAHHQGIIHRDIKPSNILINEDGKPFLTDFGLAKALTETVKISQSGALLGTPAYMSPEQASPGAGNTVDIRSDIYSLGAVFYEMLTGQRAFDGDSVYSVLFKIVGEPVQSPREINAEVPAALELVCLKALAKKKEERYPNATDMAGAINKYLSGKTTPLHWYVPELGIVKWAKRLAWVVSLLLLLAATVWFVLSPLSRDLWHRLVNPFQSQPDKEQFLQIIATLEKEYSAQFSEDQKDTLRLARESYGRKEYGKSRSALRDLVRATEQQNTVKKYLENAIKCLYLAELAELTDQESWDKARSFVKEVYSRVRDDALIKEMEEYIVEARKEAFAEYYSQAKRHYQAGEWQECAKALQKGFEYHLVHPALQDMAIKVGEKVTPSKPFEWSEDRWLACWNKKESCLDFTCKAWTTMPPALQAKYARAYQLWYAQRRCICWEHEWVASGTKFMIVLIPPGKFTTGSSSSEKDRDNDEIEEVITIREPFWISRYEVTQAQWEAVMGVNPAMFRGNGKAPVESVSWNDCRKFCEKVGMQIPSEARWEYACRAGVATPFNSGDNVTTDQVNYNGNYPYLNGALGVYRAKTVQVGSLPNGNAWDCFDFHGNVREWCNEYRGRSSPIRQSVHRGGSWDLGARECRAAHRRVAEADYKGKNVGLRPCLSGR
jgi:serine/threonine protein kinase/formylglycine-generating enzyme required for sulfatase activity